VTVLCAAALDSDPLGCELLRAVIRPGSEVPRPSQRRGPGEVISLDVAAQCPPDHEPALWLGATATGTKQASPTNWSIKG
jgi:hypothetical protein